MMFILMLACFVWDVFFLAFSIAVVISQDPTIQKFQSITSWVIWFPRISTANGQSDPRNGRLDMSGPCHSISHFCSISSETPEFELHTFSKLVSGWCPSSLAKWAYTIHTISGCVMVMSYLHPSNRSTNQIRFIFLFLFGECSFASSAGVPK